MTHATQFLPTIFRGIAACALVGAAAVSCFAQEVPAPESKKLVVGTRNIPPFAMKGDEDTWNGVSIGLWKAIADDLKVDTSFANSTMCRDCSRPSRSPKSISAQPL